MNKQRYLAELQRLLVFMTADDRAQTIRRYADLFDAVGPEGEAELIGRIGSPTKTAISLSRGYQPGKLPETLPDAPELPQQKPAPVLTQEEGDPWGDLPSFDLPDYIPPDVPGQDEDENGGAAHDRFSMPDLPGAADTDEPETKERLTGIPLGLGIPLFILVFLALGIPLFVLALALFVVLLVPGAALLFGAYLIAVGGLWSTGYMADACLLFGAALIVLAIGLIVLFGGLWLGVKLVGLYFLGLRWLCDGLLSGRRSAEDA